MKKFIITAFLAVGIFVTCITPAHAAGAGSVISLVKDMFGVCLETVNQGEDAWVAARNQINSHWQSYSSVSSMGRLYLSYETISSLTAELNGQGIPCRLEFNRNLQLYVICGVGEVGSVPGVYVTGLYLTNGSRDLFCCEYNTDSLLSTISSTLSSFQSNVQKSLVQIYSKLSDILDSVSTGVSHLNSISNYLSSDLTTYLQDIASSSAAASSSLSQLSTKMDSVVDTLTTENGKNSLFYPITRRLDSIIASLGSSPVNTGSLRRWRVDDGTIGSLNYSDIGYDALSSLMETVTASYLDYQVVSGNSLYYLDSVDSLSIVFRKVGNKYGYFIQCVGKYRQSVNGINQFFDGVFYLTEKNGTIFYSSLDSSSIFHLSRIDERIDLISNKVFDLPAYLKRFDDYFFSIEGALLGIGSKLDIPLGSFSSDLSSIVSALSTIIDKMDNLPASVDNIVVNITEDNSAYNIFYVTDENGDKKSVTSVAGDSMAASGKLLQFLYKLIIGAAISDVDNSISGLNDFYFDTAPSGLGEGVTVWD